MRFLQARVARGWPDLTHSPAGALARSSSPSQGRLAAVRAEGCAPASCVQTPGRSPLLPDSLASFLPAVPGASGRDPLTSSHTGGSGVFVEPQGCGRARPGALFLAETSGYFWSSPSAFHGCSLQIMAAPSCMVLVVSLNAVAGPARAGPRLPS